MNTRISDLRGLISACFSVCVGIHVCFDVCIVRYWEISRSWCMGSLLLTGRIDVTGIAKESHIYRMEKKNSYFTMFYIYTIIQQKKIKLKVLFFAE